MTAFAILNGTYNSTVDKEIVRACRSEGQVEVNTVDSFQGQERDVVLVSLARSHGVGFLTDAGRMNVMLTRARHSLLVCLNHNALLVSILYSIIKTLERCQRTPGWNEVPFD